MHSFGNSDMNMNYHSLRRLCTLALLSLAASATAAEDVVIHAGTLIDGISAVPLNRMSIVVRDDKIVAVEKGFQTSNGALVIDLSDSTVMPGFIDSHIHISAKLPSSTNATQNWVTHSTLDRAFDGALFARQMLQQGFTSGRDVGGGDDSVALRDAIQAGKISGPRLWVSLEPLGPTAGHGDPGTGMDPALSNESWDNGLVDSPQQARFRVRQHKQRGADLIKIMPSGGIASTGTNPRQQLMTNDEIRAAVDTAHAMGMKVAAHSYPAPVIENAVRAGVDSVEHGSFATADTYALMKKHGTYLVPTLTVYDVFYAVARDHPELLTPGTAQKELDNDLLPKKNLPLAIESGVMIAYGTDLGEGNHAMEFRLLIEGGMRPMDAIFAATRQAADLLGASDKVGSVQAGRYADIVATKGNPLTDTDEFERVTFVMKGGVVYRTDSKATAAGANGDGAH
jgi:imidazolonepropionase-like amidohydrolase